MGATEESDDGGLGVSGRDRFLVELEFVQCLANPAYLNWLAQSRVLADPAFAAYLKYLLYWRRPEYACFIVYPHALALLELLQTPEFREAVASPGYKELLHAQQFFAWQHYAKARRREAAAERERGGGEGGGEGVAASG